MAVTGGRKWRDAGFVRRCLYGFNRNHPITGLIHGGAKGWDSYCDMIARDMGLEPIVINAEWDDLTHPDARIRKRNDGTLYDANAGSRRNGWILDLQPDALFAGPGGYGTANMIAQARARGIAIFHAIL